VWVLIPFAPDWRWQLYRSDSPWYTTMRLFRQNKLGDWQSVLIVVQNALEKLSQSVNYRADVMPGHQPTTIINSPPTNIEQLFNTACQYYANGQYTKAIAQYEEIISLGVKNAQVNFNLAFIYDQQGDIDRAISNYQAAITYQPDYSPAYSNLADILIKQERFSEAKNYLEQAIKINPVFAESYYNLGNVYLKLEQLPEAVKAYEKAIAVNPKLSAAHFNLANTYASLERPVDAIASYRQAISVNPQYAEAYNNLGNMLRDREEWDEAITSYSQVVSLQPDFVGSVYTNLAVSLEARGSMSEALIYYHQSVKDAPKYAEAHLNLGMALLTIGDFTEGWQEYEWRSLTAQSVPREFPKPSWDGSDLTGKTILIHTEQGLGDAIMFIRYIDLVKARGGENSQIILECRPPVARLFQCLTAIDCIIIDGNPHPVYDVQIALMSLPLIFQTTLETIPSAIPYLQVNSQPIDLPIKPQTKLKIGIVWGANFQHSTSNKRSCPVSYFTDLTNMSEVQLFSLQKGPQVADLAEYPEITNLDHLIHDLADTANIINQLDLVISVD
ncbi:MAG: tetratricopeptide repeat protein, partial [Microcoleaceae cyanobacterium]